MSCSHSVLDLGLALEKRESRPTTWTELCHSIQDNTYTKPHALRLSLAYFEMRLILCKLLFNFDIALSPESINWPDQKVYFLWEKPPLMVKLTDRFPDAELPLQEPLTMFSN